MIKDLIEKYCNSGSTEFAARKASRPLANPSANGNYYFRFDTYTLSNGVANVSDNKWVWAADILAIIYVGDFYVPEYDYTGFPMFKVIGNDGTICITDVWAAEFFFFEQGFWDVQNWSIFKGVAKPGEFILATNVLTPKAKVLEDIQEYETENIGTYYEFLTTKGKSFMTLNFNDASYILPID